MWSPTRVCSRRLGSRWGKGPHDRLLCLEPSRGEPDSQPCGGGTSARAREIRGPSRQHNDSRRARRCRSRQLWGSRWIAHGFAGAGGSGAQRWRRDRCCWRLLAALPSAWRRARSSHRSTTDNPSPCPRGSPYRPGVSGIGEYVDFLRFDGRTYFGRSASISASQLGPVVTRVRCSLTAAEDPSRTPPQIIDGTASFLRAGTPVYAVRGYSPTCRLAAYLNGHYRPTLLKPSTARPRRLPGHAP
jgi:hypothetical protein